MFCMPFKRVCYSSLSQAKKDKLYFKALQMSEEIWEFLADNPNKGKIHFPKIEEYRLDEMPHRCPLCDTMYKGIISNCSNCILDSVCMSAYSTWTLTTDIDKRQECATIIWKKLFEERLRLM